MLTQEVPLADDISPVDLYIFVNVAKYDDSVLLAHTKYRRRSPMIKAKMQLEE